MIIQSFISGPLNTNTYVVACAETKQAIIIDPAPGSTDAIYAYCIEHHLKCQAILLTHSHWDHIADVEPLRERISMPIYIHSADTPNLECPGSDGLTCWIHVRGVKTDKFLVDEQNFSVGHLTLQVIHTPGHTPGSVCFYSPQHHVLISGDTLFKGSIGSISFPTSQPEKMWNSLDKLAKLPPETVIHTGHGPTTTIGAEKWLSRAQAHFGE